MFGRTKHEGLEPVTEGNEQERLEALNTFRQRAGELKSLGLFLLKGRNASFVMQGVDRRLVISQTFDDTVRVHTVSPMQESAAEKTEGSDVTVNGTVVLIDGMSYDQTHQSTYPRDVLDRFAIILTNTRENVLQMMDESLMAEWQKWREQSISSGIGAASVVNS